MSPAAKVDNAARDPLGVKAADDEYGDGGHGWGGEICYMVQVELVANVEQCRSAECVPPWQGGGLSFEQWLLIW